MAHDVTSKDDLETDGSHKRCPEYERVMLNDTTTGDRMPVEPRTVECPCCGWEGYIEQTKEDTHNGRRIFCCPRCGDEV